MANRKPAYGAKEIKRDLGKNVPVDEIAGEISDRHPDFTADQCASIIEKVVDNVKLTAEDWKPWEVEETEDEEIEEVEEVKKPAKASKKKVAKAEPKKETKAKAEPKEKAQKEQFDDEEILSRLIWGMSRNQLITMLKVRDSNLTDDKDRQGS